MMPNILKCPIGMLDAVYVSSVSISIPRASRCRVVFSSRDSFASVIVFCLIRLPLIANSDSTT